jgi:DNA polymerase-3 subunit delta'
MNTIIGHMRERETLRNISRSGCSQRCFLLSGPSGIGKSLVAEEFARELLNADTRASADFSLDLLVLSEAAAGNPAGRYIVRDLSIESVREAKDFLGRYPSASAFRVVIVNDAERLSATAQNALLKVLEEPNPTSAIILVSSGEETLLPTILSRVIQIPLRLVPERTIREGILVSFPDESRSLEPFFYTLGRPGIVIRFILDPGSFGDRREVLRSLFRVSSLSYAERAKLSETLAEDISDSAELLEWWLSGLRSAALREADGVRIGRYFEMLERIDRGIRTLRSVPVNAKLFFDAMLFPL